MVAEPGTARTARLRLRRRRLLAAVGVTLAVVVTVLGRYEYVALQSASMAPWAEPGALLLHRPVPSADVEVGDVLTVDDDGTLVTNRVVEVLGDGADVSVVLQGDASELPDPEPYVLGERVWRVTQVVPRVGGWLQVGATLLWWSLGLIAIGWLTLIGTSPRRAANRHWIRIPAAEPVTLSPLPVRRPARETAAPVGGLDPRIEALLETADQLREDGVAETVVRDLVLVRTSVVLGLPSVEASPAADSLDDGGRFYIVALVDADADALAAVPSTSMRRLAGSAVVSHWWRSVAERVPPTVMDALPR